MRDEFFSGGPLELEAKRFWNGALAKRLSRGVLPQANELSVPIARYFIYVGGVLFALLFTVNWIWQNPSPMPSYGSPLDEKIVRIRSEHKWPRKVELDTTIPTIMPPPAPVAETVTAEAALPSEPKPASNALAQASPPQKHVAKRRPAAHARYRNPNSAGELRFAVNPMPPAWPAGWQGAWMRP